MCGGFSGGVRAVVTSDAATGDLPMVYGIGNPVGARSMASFALIGSGRMGGAFTARRRSVMAGRAGLRTGLAVIELRGFPCRRGVAVVAAQRRGNVRGPLAGRDLVIMAVLAQADHLFVVYGRHEPVRVRTMTGFAHVGGFDVCAALAARVAAIMTADAIAGNAVVIKCCRHPGNGAVARAALLGGDAMACGFRMARRTHTDHLRVIDRVDYPLRGDSMARFAHIAAVDVPRTLAGRISTVVATDAIIRDALVIKGRRRPGIGTVAIAALARGSYMRCGLLAEMAARAGTDRLRMIDALGAPIGIRLMTGLAQVGAGDVARSLAARVAAVVATQTIIREALVIERCRCPGVGTVAIAALARGE